MTTDTTNKLVKQRVIIDGKELRVIGVAKKKDQV